MNYPLLLKIRLLHLIHAMADDPSPFVRNPLKDFSRVRKLPFESMIRLLLSFQAASVNNELLSFFHFSPVCPKASAFNQQRSKILPDAFAFLFFKFNQMVSSPNSYRGYQLLACDGSDLSIPHNPFDSNNYFKHPSAKKGFNLLHLDALYDLCNRRYVDAIIQSGKNNSECRALTEMVDRFPSSGKTIFIADRGYECYNVFAHIQQNDSYYLIRVRDQSNRSITSSLNQLPDSNEFDIPVSLLLTRKASKDIKNNSHIYKYLSQSAPFDYLDLKEHPFYPLSFRVVRFPISEDTYECVITNLPKEDFPASELKKIYAMRWGIETSFRELKYTIGLSNYHAKKAEYIKQEIYARLILYNFCELITTHVVIKQKETKYLYQLNYTTAVYICRNFLKSEFDTAPPDVEALIAQYLYPIRPGRHFPHNVSHKTSVSFLYRAV